jgi:hypothetical protein
LAEGFRRGGLADEALDPVDRAVNAWRGLFWGRWRMQQANPASGGAMAFVGRAMDGTHRPLPTRQRQALFYASVGWSQLEIAFALAVDAVTAATHVRRGLDAVGLAKRSHWIQLSAAVSSELAKRAQDPST